MSLRILSSWLLLLVVQHDTQAQSDAGAARDEVLHASDAVTLDRIAQVNKLIDEHNRRLAPGEKALEPLKAEHTRKFTVFVYERRDNRWVRDDGRSFVTNDRQQARNYVAQNKNVAGWTATTNAPETVPLDNSILPPPFRKLVPLHKPLGTPQPGDWLAEHEEFGQSYAQYVAGNPVRPTRQRRVLYIQPLGEFTKTERKIVDLTAEYMGHFFQLPVRVREDLPLSVIPERARRPSFRARTPQILSTYVLDDVLKPRLPPDAVALIAFTASDLWPGEGWNYVFGQASLVDRVGVWSMSRFGNPDESHEAYQLALCRTFGVATHETGHMFSMAHCTYYECSMCGSESLPESDRYPLWNCPQCLAKLCYATGADPAKRFKDLIAFAQANDLAEEAEFWQKSLAALSK